MVGFLGSGCLHNRRHVHPIGIVAPSSKLIDMRIQSIGIVAVIICIVSVIGNVFMLDWLLGQWECVEGGGLSIREGRGVGGVESWGMKNGLEGRRIAADAVWT